MPLSMHRASVPVFARALEVLATLLEKGEAHAKAQGQNPDDLVAARLVVDGDLRPGRSPRMLVSVEVKAVP